jgi:hypothetical protein
MPVSSLSLRRLDQLLAETGVRQTVGLDQLREITSQLRDMAAEMDSATKTVVAWTLIQSLQSLCEKYDGEPMTVNESAAIAHFVRGPVRDALRFLGNNAALSDSMAIDLMVRVIEKH